VRVDGLRAVGLPGAGQPLTKARSIFPSRNCNQLMPSVDKPTFMAIATTATTDANQLEQPTLDDVAIPHHLLVARRTAT
jgi:hypothetical protein